MGGHQREGENILGRVVEGAALGAVGAVVAESLREAYRPGYQNLPPQGYQQLGYQGESFGQNSLPRFEIERMHEDSRMAANDLLRSGGRDQRLAQMELQHAGLIDREYKQNGRYYQEALRELSRDVSQESHGTDRLVVERGYNGGTDLHIVPNEQPLYPRTPAPNNYYNQNNIFGPPRFKR